MDKPKILHGLVFSDTKGNPVINEPIGITFYVDNDMENHIQNRHRYWEGKTGKKLVIAEDSADTMEEIKIRKILKMTASYMGVPLKVVKESSKRKPVEVKRQTIMICINRKMSVTTIGLGLSIKHDMVIYHRETYQRLAETDKQYRDNFLEMEDYILTELNGNFESDGTKIELK